PSVHVRDVALSAAAFLRAAPVEAGDATSGTGPRGPSSAARGEQARSFVRRAARTRRHLRTAPPRASASRTWGSPPSLHHGGNGACTNAIGVCTARHVRARRATLWSDHGPRALAHRSNARDQAERIPRRSSRRRNDAAGRVREAAPRDAL